MDNQILIEDDYGELYHQTDDYISTNYIFPPIADFILEVIFENPYNASSGVPWDYGILFRREGANDNYRLIITSYGEWTLINSTPNDLNYSVQSGAIKNLLYEESQANKIKLVALKDTGYLFVNDHFIANLDLSERLEPGDILLATGINGYEKEDAVTRYSDLNLWIANPSSTLEANAAVTLAPWQTSTATAVWQTATAVMNANSSSEEIDCSVLKRELNRHNHSLSKSNFYNLNQYLDYQISMTNPSSRMANEFTLDLALNSARSSPRCGVDEREVLCVNDHEAKTLNCEFREVYAYLANVQSAYCVFEIQVNHSQCGTIYSYDLANEIHGRR